MSYLVARVEWLERYQGVEEFSPYMGYGRAGNTPHEIYNFLPHSDGYCYGYVQVPAGGQLNIEKLGAARRAASVKGCTVVFIARSPGAKDYYVVGAYLDCEVFREHLENPAKEVQKTISGARFYLKCPVTRAVLVPEENRSFRLKYRGQAQITYQFNDPAKDMSALDAYLEGEASHGHRLSEVLEERVKKLAVRYERRGDVRKLVLPAEGKLICETCGISHSAHKDDPWKGIFEVHHRFPMHLLEEGEERGVKREDLALLCANCHRAIHRTPDVSDVMGFAAIPKPWQHAN